MKVLPSTSVIVAPRPSAITMGKVIESGPATTCSFRARISFDFGPGMAVLSSIVRVIAMSATIHQRPAAMHSCIEAIHRKYGRASRRSGCVWCTVHDRPSPARPPPPQGDRGRVDPAHPPRRVLGKRRFEAVAGAVLNPGLLRL